MATRKLLMPGATLAVGLAAGLLAQQASATEELVVYGNAPAVSAREAYRAEVESYMRSVSAQIKATIEADRKSATARKIEVAANELQARG